MVNKITNGIVGALYDEFKCNIYTESIEQGLEEPCFCISSLNSSVEQKLSKNYNCNYPFIIQYFPSTDDVNEECNSVLERMFYCLELITVGEDLTRGDEMSGEITDNVLNFKVNYNIFVRKIEKLDEMEDYKVDQGVRNEI